MAVIGDPNGLGPKWRITPGEPSYPWTIDGADAIGGTWSVKAGAVTLNLGTPVDGVVTVPKMTGDQASKAKQAQRYYVHSTARDQPVFWGPLLDAKEGAGSPDDLVEVLSVDGDTLTITVPGGGGAPSGPAGGDLAGTYPNPTVPALTSKVPNTRTIAGLDLTVDRTAAALRSALTLVVGTDVQAFDSDLAAIAALTTTTFGRSLLTAASAAAARSTLGAASPSDVTTAVNALVDAAPGALDTLNELAAALGDDPNFAATVTSALTGKASQSDLDDLAATVAGKQLKFTYHDAAWWAVNDPVIPAGEWGWANDTNVLKAGDGQTRWTGLPAHVAAQVPAGLLASMDWRRYPDRTFPEVPYILGPDGFLTDDQWVPSTTGPGVLPPLPQVQVGDDDGGLTGDTGALRVVDGALRAPDVGDVSVRTQAIWLLPDTLPDQLRLSMRPDGWRGKVDGDDMLDLRATINHNLLDLGGSGPTGRFTASGGATAERTRVRVGMDYAYGQYVTTTPIYLDLVAPNVRYSLVVDFPGRRWWVEANGVKVPGTEVVMNDGGDHWEVRDEAGNPLEDLSDPPAVLGDVPKTGEGAFDLYALHSVLCTVNRGDNGWQGGVLWWAMTDGLDWDPDSTSEVDALGDRLAALEAVVSGYGMTAGADSLTINDGDDPYVITVPDGDLTTNPG